jgi:signal peptidase I
MEQWAREWLEEERANGAKCLEIKNRGSKHYVYESTTHWDSVLKKRVKTSKYKGKLDPEQGFIESKGMNGFDMGPIRNVTEYGNAMLLRVAMEDLKPLLMDSFPDNWEAIYALSMVRICGNVPLKRSKVLWEKLYNPDAISPNMNPGAVSKLLRTVGIDREAQDLVFQGILDHSKQLIYDLSTMFSRSMNIQQAEKGYNKDKIHLPQINLALLCSADTGFPTMIKSVPGSVRDISTLVNTIKEINIEGKTLVADRGFFSDDTIKTLSEENIDFVLPTRRNSQYYDVRIHLNEHFRYHKRLIECGKRKVGDIIVYKFEDLDLKLEETKTLYERLDKGKIDKNELREKLKNAGTILILSSKDLPEQEIYELYKKRERVEKLFDTYKNVLDADRLYLQDDESVFGHVFISFLSLYAYSKLEAMLKKAGLNNKMSPIDLLLQYSKVFHLEIGDQGLISEIPKKLRDLEKMLGTNVFPTE